MDDFTIHEKTGSELLKHLEAFFTICTKQKGRLSPKKGLFPPMKVRWCKRVIDSEGYQLNPRKMQAIRNMDAPTGAAGLCPQISCCP